MHAFGRVLPVLALTLVVTGAVSSTLHAQSSPTDIPSTLLTDYRWRSIGPGSPGGRFTDVEALDTDFRFVLAAAASGGVWKSTNAGTTWTPIFDRYGSSSIGDIKIYQADPRILWVGTGEANNRNSVAWGDGVYKSTDGGQTFANVGLRTTHQIARIVTHPSNPDVVYVAALGNLWGATGDRGVFKTSDGGKSWQKLAGGLPSDPTSGATELVMDPANPNVLYTAFYQRLRLPWRFNGGGTHGGIFKSADGGKTWRKLTAGLPAGPTGRIGLDVYRKNPKIVVAIVEAEPGSENLTKPGSGIYRSEDGGTTWKYLNRYNNRPFYYSQIRVNPSDDKLVYVLATAMSLSTDGGKTLVQARAPYGGNYDHHAMWIDPTNKDRFYLGKDKGLTLTHDHGATFLYYDNLPIMQAYKVAVDLRDPYAVYAGLQDNGTFGTMSFTRDGLGIRNDVAWKLHWDDGQYIAIDPTDWRTVYSQGTNASFRVVDPLTHTDTPRRVSPATITNFRDVAPADSAAGSLPRFRVNWSTPFIISPHAPNVVYYGSNYLLKSIDKGVSWTAISKDLSKADPTKNMIGTGGLTPDASGAEGFATIFSVSESPVAKGTLWAGTDDGNVWLTRDEGATWQQVDANIPDVPKGTWVSRVVASASDANTAYVSFDGHRSDDRRAWLFRTTDGGRTWTNLSAGLAANSPVYVVEESAKNPDLLFVGTEHGVQVSLDRGATWRPMMNGLPTVAVYDIVIHPRDRDVILGTHGRGVYLLDDISALEQWRPALATAAVHLFTQRPATLWVDQSRGGQLGEQTYFGQNPPSIAPADFQGRDRARVVNTPLITFAFGAGATGNATLEITSPSGATRSVAIPANAGITRFAWDMRMQNAGADAGGGARGRSGAGGARAAGARPAEPGTYTLKLIMGAHAASGTLMLRPDPLLP
ncbi:MAG: WD40/YVTN/BNR-like repeat-containing protein [Gemmatimonadaceae bacterium]